MVSLFVVIIFNNSIVAENEFNIDTSSSDLTNAKKMLMDLDKDTLREYVENEDYDELLKFMGNGSKIVKNAHVNASGRGLYLGKRIKYIGWASPFPRLTRIGFPAPALVNQWLLYIKFNNNSFKDPVQGGKIVYSNANTYIEPENGDEPILIQGNHSILALVWQILPINRFINTKMTLIRWYNEINGLNKSNKVNATFPWSIEKWKFKNFWNFITVPPALMFLVIRELMFMIMGWPFNVWTSFLNHIWPSSIRGMATFVIYNDSTADP
jgi:hypothetical protein